MSKTTAWFALYPGDYLRDTSHLTIDQSGAYLHLLMAYWCAGPLPSDQAQLAAICRVSETRFTRRLWPALTRFFTEQDGQLRQKRMDAERERVGTILEKRVYAAKNRWEKVRTSTTGQTPRSRKPAVAGSNSGKAKRAKSDGSVEHMDIHPHPHPHEDKKESPPAADSPTRDMPPREVDLISGSAVVPFKATPTREAFDAWNAMAVRLDLPRAVAFTDARKRRLAARLKDCGGPAGWIATLAHVEASDWLCGRLPNKKWKVDLDWLLQPHRFGTVSDGACRDWGKGSSGYTTGHEWMANLNPSGPPEFEFDGVTLDGEAEQA